MTTKSNRDIDLESEEYVPVGHIWKFDLEGHKIRDFRVKFYFSKFRMEPVMLSFLATTENTKRKIRTTKFTNAGKCLRKQQEIAIRNFQIQNKTRVM